MTASTRSPTLGPAAADCGRNHIQGHDGRCREGNDHIKHGQGIDHDSGGHPKLAPMVKDEDNLTLALNKEYVPVGEV